MVEELTLAETSEMMWDASSAMSSEMRLVGQLVSWWEEELPLGDQSVFASEF
jgi:hypothetical protein